MLPHKEYSELAITVQEHYNQVKIVNQITEVKGLISEFGGGALERVGQTWSYLRKDLPIKGAKPILAAKMLEAFAVNQLYDISKMRKHAVKHFSNSQIAA